MLIGRFIGFLRALAPFLAGASGTRFAPFLVYDLIGAGAWATAFLLLGYFLGEGYKAAGRYIGRGGLVLALAAAGIWAAVVLVRRYRVTLSGLRLILRKEVIFTAWFLAGASLLVALAEDIAENETLEYDRRTLLWIHAHAGPVLDHIMVFLTQMGSLPFIALLVVAAGMVLYAKGNRLGARLYASAVVAGILAGSLIKYGLHRPRPELWPLLVKVPPYSFPSGHTVAASMAFWFLAWILFRDARRWWWTVTAALSLLVPLLVGFTRLYLGVHWPSDVIGGYALAVTMLAPCFYFYELSRREKAAATAPVADERS